MLNGSTSRSATNAHRHTPIFFGIFRNISRTSITAAADRLAVRLIFRSFINRSFIEIYLLISSIIRCISSASFAESLRCAVNAAMNAGKEP